MRTWPGLLLVPFIALAQQTFNYALVPWACSTGRQDLLHWVALASLSAAVAIALYQWRVWRASENAMAGAQLVSRRRFLAWISTLSAAFFSLVIAAMWSAQWIVPPCAT
jgi:hypothetical protein